MATKAKIKRIVRGRKATQKSKSKLSQLNWPAILIAVAVLVGLFSYGRELFVSPSEAARSTTILNPSTTAGGATQGRDYGKEASDIFFNEYSYHCFKISDPAERCSCTAEVLKKLEALRAEVIAAGYDNYHYYQQLLMRIQFYIDHIRKTMADWGCDESGALNPPTQATTVRWWQQLFRTR